MPVKDEVDDWVKESGQEQVTSAFSACSSDLEQSREGVGVRKISGPDGVTYEYSYDDNNQLTGVEIPGKGFVTYTSYTWNRPASVTLPGGSQRDYEYDPLMRVKSITAKDPAQNVLLNYQYTYDKMDNIVSKGTEHGAYAHGYDDVYRLTSTDNPDFDDEGCTYDPVGNRLTAANTTGEWSYNDNNELSGYDSVSYDYDANGNMTKKTVGSVVTSYVYNIEDRLSEVWDGEVGTGSLTAAYYYDPFGRRLWKEVSGTTTYFFYADEGLVGEYDASGTEIKTYGYKPGSTWTTDPLFMKVDNNYYFYHNDHLGTPQKMTGVNGAVVWEATYGSFGEALVEVETVESNLRYPGQYYDQETGLHYNWYRYYDPIVGRYLRTDPYKFASILNNGLVVKSLYRIFKSSYLSLINRFYSKGDKYTIDNSLYSSFKNQSLKNYISNPYRQNYYVYNNPMNNIDPMGLMSEKTRCKLKFYFSCHLTGSIGCHVAIPTGPIYLACEIAVAIYCHALMEDYGEQYCNCPE